MSRLARALVADLAGVPMVQAALAAGISVAALVPVLQAETPARYQLADSEWVAVAAALLEAVP